MGGKSRLSTSLLYLTTSKWWTIKVENMLAFPGDGAIVMTRGDGGFLYLMLD